MMTMMNFDLGDYDSIYQACCCLLYLDGGGFSRLVTYGVMGACGCIAAVYSGLCSPAFEDSMVCHQKGASGCD